LANCAAWRARACCARARELQLSDDHGGLLELAADAPLGQNVRETLRLDDSLLTVKLTPNLAHCLSVYGVAREVAALTGAPLSARHSRPFQSRVRQAAGQGERARPVRPLLGPRGAQRRSQGR
jgi:hypothetical protein